MGNVEGETGSLLARVRAGDISAAGRLFARYRPRLCRLVRTRIDSRIQARLDPSDVVQETLLCACRRLPELVDNDAPLFRAWLQRIMTDRLIDFRRQHVDAKKRSVTKERTLDLCGRSVAECAEPGASDTSERDQPALRPDREELIRWLLVQLPEHDREILLMRHMAGLTNDECATILGVTTNAVKKRYLRALCRIRLILEAESEDRSRD